MAASHHAALFSGLHGRHMSKRLSGMLGRPAPLLLPTLIFSSRGRRDTQNCGSKHTISGQVFLFVCWPLEQYYNTQTGIQNGIMQGLLFSVISIAAGYSRKIPYSAFKIICSVNGNWREKASLGMYRACIIPVTKINWQPHVWNRRRRCRI